MVSLRRRHDWKYFEPQPEATQKAVEESGPRSWIYYYNSRGSEYTGKVTNAQSLEVAMTTILGDMKMRDLAECRNFRAIPLDAMPTLSMPKLFEEEEK